jgi:hypothetical protein
MAASGSDNTGQWHGSLLDELLPPELRCTGCGTALQPATPSSVTTPGEEPAQLPTFPAPNQDRSDPDVVMWPNPSVSAWRFRSHVPRSPESLFVARAPQPNEELDEAHQLINFLRNAVQTAEQQYHQALRLASMYQTQMMQAKRGLGQAHRNAARVLSIGQQNRLFTYVDIQRLLARSRLTRSPAAADPRMRRTMRPSLSPWRTPCSGTPIRLQLPSERTFLKSNRFFYPRRRMPYMPLAMLLYNIRANGL